MDGAGVTGGEGDRSIANPTATSHEAYPNFAFLVHSQTSLMQDLPPKVDTAMTARQKRRRTSPEDHTILEAAYLENSKPDKSERVEIVKRVSLSEKEVQIWFQNRRQNDRRKSRPLLPHEMVPHFRNSVPQVLLDSSLPGDIAPTGSHSAPWSAGELPCPTSGDDPENSSSATSSIHDILNPPSSAKSQTTTSSDPPPPAEHDLQVGQCPTSVSRQGTVEAITQNEKEIDATSYSQDTKTSPSGVKRSHDEMAEKTTNAGNVTSVPVCYSSSRASHVRLSMSLDGSVKIKTTDEETPSPPKQHAPAPPVPPKPAGSLQRSKSAILLGATTSERSVGKSKTKAGGGQFGRSRDARTWEFYCDGDAREALTTHAESERTGSAVGAINLIRSQSQKARAQPTIERIGASRPKTLTVSQQGVKPKMSRAMSTMGRLQDTDQTFVKPKLRGGDASAVESPSGDSDKENWIPGTRSSYHPLRRPNTSTSHQTVLEDENPRLSYVSGAGGPSSGNRGAVQGRLIAKAKDNINRSHQQKTLVEEGGKGEDLDCVQGLLSLSQGAWQ